MAIDIVIENKSKFLRNKKKITHSILKDLLGEENTIGYFKSPISRWENLDDRFEHIENSALSIVGEHVYGRGINININNDSSIISCSLLVPTVSVEIALFEWIVNQISNYVNAKTVLVEGEKIKIGSKLLSSELEDFALYGSMQETKENLILRCSLNPIYIESNMYDKLIRLEKTDFITQFENYLIEKLTCDLYYAEARGYNMRDETGHAEEVKIFTITDDVDSIFPNFEKYPNFKTFITGYIASTNTYDEETLGPIDYNIFLKHIENYKIKDYDAKHIIIKMNREQMKDLWNLASS